MLQLFPAYNKKAIAINNNNNGLMRAGRRSRRTLLIDRFKRKQQGVLTNKSGYNPGCRNG